MYWKRVCMIILVSSLLFFIYNWSILFGSNPLGAIGSTGIFLAALMLLATGVPERPRVALWYALAAGCLIFIALSCWSTPGFGNAVAWLLVAAPLTFVFAIVFRGVYLKEDASD